jgi:hypothetical protein
MFLSFPVHRTFPIHLNSCIIFYSMDTSWLIS